MLSVEQILALAPDAASSKAAQGLLAPAKWTALGHTESAVWGECQGSGKKPYQVVIDRSGPSFKCTCPSRKFPCKHGLALFLLLAQKGNDFVTGDAPAWADEWLAARRERAEKQADKKSAQAAARPKATADPQAAAKRKAQRMDRMQEGARELERWLADLVRQGLAELPAKPVSFWRDAAARLVDAQAPGLGNTVGDLETVVGSGEDWPRRALLRMGRLQLLLEALGRQETLSEPLWYDVRGTAGWPLDKEEVFAKGERVEDAWYVSGVSFDEKDRLWERRVWLRGVGTGRNALLLDFSHGQRHFEFQVIPGTTIAAPLVFFPSAFPLRALVVDESPTIDSPPLREAAQCWDDAFQIVAEALSRNPWLPRIPLCLSRATPYFHEGRWFARDGDSRDVPLRATDNDGWQLLALSGGAPIAIFGEWLGERWRPLSAWSTSDPTPCWTETIPLS